MTLFTKKSIKGFILLIAAVWGFPLIAQIPDAKIDDAPVEEGLYSSEKKQEKKGTEKEKKIKTDYRLFSIGTFSYQPISDTNHPAVVNGVFNEKSFNALLNLDLNIHPVLKGNSSIVFRTDIEGVVSTLYPNDTIFFSKNYGDYIRLDELFVQASPTSNVSFLFGKYRHLFSPGLFQNPLDRHNPTATLPGEPAAREGAWLSMFSYDNEFNSNILSGLRISLAFLPGFFLDTSGLPVWERDVRVISPASPIGFVSEKEYYNSTYAGGFARIYLNLFQGDFNLMYYYTEKQNQAGLSYSRYFGNIFEWHGEVLFYQNPHGRYTPADPNALFYTDALTGIRLDFDNNLSFFLEYLYRQDNPANYPSGLIDQKRIWLGLLGADQNSHAMTPLRSYIILTMMMIDIKDIFDVSANIIFNPNDFDAIYSLRCDYKVDKSSKISIAGLFKSGSSDTFYGSYLPFDYQLRLEFYIALL